MITKITKNKEVQLVYSNLTPHQINIYQGENLVKAVPPSGEIARVTITSKRVLTDSDGVTLYSSIKGKVEGLPESKPNTILIVSRMVLDAAMESDRTRSDLASPGNLIRNDKGQPIGCHGLFIS